MMTDSILEAKKLHTQNVCMVAGGPYRNFENFGQSKNHPPFLPVL